jgi:hypothetical protein
MKLTSLTSARWPRHNFPTNSPQVRRRNEPLGEWKVNIETTMELLKDHRQLTSEAGPAPGGGDSDGPGSRQVAPSLQLPRRWRHGLPEFSQWP